MRLLIARHCRTRLNAEGRMQGHLDIPLDEEGERQAGELAKSVAGLGIERVVCSDLTRALMTAACVSVSAQVSVWPDPRWRECGFGSLEGKTLEEYRVATAGVTWSGPDAVHQDFTSFGGEKGSDVLARQLAALDELKRSFDDKLLMVIGHGRSLRILLEHLGHPTDHLRMQGSYLLVDY